MKPPIGALVLGVLLSATSVAAQQPRQPSPAPAPVPTPAPEASPRMRGPAPVGERGFAVGVYHPSHLLERRDVLSLTPDQVTRLSTLENELKAAHEKAAAELKPQREELAKLLQQSAPDVAQVRTRAQAVMQAEQAVRLTTLTTSLQAKAVLTPEQRGRVQGWADGGRMGMGMRRPMMRRGPGGPDGPGAPPRAPMRRMMQGD